MATVRSAFLPIGDLWQSFLLRPRSICRKYFLLLSCICLQSGYRHAILSLTIHIRIYRVSCGSHLICILVLCFFYWFISSPINTKLTCVPYILTNVQQKLRTFFHPNFTNPLYSLSVFASVALADCCLGLNLMEVELCCLPTFLTSCMCLFTTMFF